MSPLARRTSITSPDAEIALHRAGQPRSERPTLDQMGHSITLLFDMAAKQANPSIKAAYVQTASWLRDNAEKLCLPVQL